MNEIEGICRKTANSVLMRKRGRQVVLLARPLKSPGRKSRVHRQQNKNATVITDRTVSFRREAHGASPRMQNTYCA